MFALWIWIHYIYNFIYIIDIIIFEDQYSYIEDQIPILFEYQPGSRAVVLRNKHSFGCFAFILIKVGIIHVC